MNPLELSTKVIDAGEAHEPVNRVTNELTELADGLAIVESFSHTLAWDTGDGLMCFDASGVGSGANVVSAIRTWSTERISSLVYTHGHADHVGGSFAFADDAAAMGAERPTVIGHENVNPRIDRYAMTSDWNLAINARQFGGIPSDMGLEVGMGAKRFLPKSTLRTDVSFDQMLTMQAGDTTVEFHHGRGETDDHLWAWIPEKKWIFTGDFIIWNYPNAGNPQKVQRYALEWAQSLRKMIAQGPELLLPAHGLPIEGKERIAMVLDDIASTLEDVVYRVVDMMNAGETLDTIIHTVKVDEELLKKPYLRPYYDEPEFVVRNIWRLYGGWWDGAASRLKPAPDAVVAAELARLSGGARVLMDRALELMETDIRLACHLADLAGWAEPESVAIHGDRAQIYWHRRRQEKSLMAQGIFRSASRASQAVAGTLDQK
jgi:glyoxylase-like metal-dependent hydrolase (beta-lactamase superfamily II)